jgi:hypothetical protein
MSSSITEIRSPRRAGRREERAILREVGNAEVLYF